MITVERLGVHYLWLRDMPEQLRAQFRLADALWNDLVAVHEAHEEARREIWSSYPDVAAAEAAIAGLNAEVEELAAQVADVRKVQRTKRPKHPSVAKLADAKKRLRDARQARRDAIAAVREEAQERLTAAHQARVAAEKGLYRRHIDQGMYWATYNDLTRRRFQAAVKRIAERRAQGLPAQLRRRRSDGTGTITVQLQRQAGDPARTPAMIADGDGGKWRNVLHIPWIRPDQWDKMRRAEQTQHGRITIRMRAGQDATGAPTWLEVPVQVNGMLQADADITEARLSVWRVGPDLRGHITVVAKIPDPEPVTAGPEVALHLGWRREDDGGIRVATWRATGPIHIPRRQVAAGIDLRDVVRAARDGLTGTVVLPARVDQRLGALDKTRSGRDDALNEMKTQLAAWVEANWPLPNPYDDVGDDPVTAGKISSWRSPARYVTLQRHLAGVAEWEGSDPLRVLTTWAGDDRRRWRSQEHGRRKVVGHRDDLWKQVAAVIAGQAGRLVVDDASIADLARVPDVPRDGDPPAQALEGVARRRVIAAPGELRALAVAAATRDGVPVVTVSAKHLSREHAGCGYINAAAAGHAVVCEGCGRTYDADASATVLMLRRASGAVDTPSSTDRS